MVLLMKFKYLDQVYLKRHDIPNIPMGFFSPEQSWTIIDIKRSSSLFYDYRIYPSGLRPEYATHLNIYVSEEWLETSKERNERLRKEEELLAIKNLEKPEIEVYKKLSAEATYPLKDVVGIRELKILPEYSYEPIFKEEK